MTGARVNVRVRILAASAVPVFALLAVLVLSQSPEASGTTGATATAARGRQLFLTGCAGCHGADARGSTQGPSLRGVGEAMADFQLSTGRMPLSDPTVQAVRKTPAYGPAEIAALVKYIGTLGGGTPIPRVDVHDADIARGFQVFRLNCAPCHSSTGNGGALSYGRAAPELHQATVTQIGEAVRTGPGQMPVFGPETIGDTQLDNLAAYVRSLRQPADPGGFSLGNAGPIPEGLVALVVGVGGLVFVASRIESKS
jgi:quinol---cytochrome-c reductase cytochrome c subunit